MSKRKSTVNMICVQYYGNCHKCPYWKGCKDAFKSTEEIYKIAERKSRGISRK